MKLLFARIGRTISPVSGKEVKRHQVSDVVNFITSFPEETRIIIGSPLMAKNGRSILEEAELLLQQGFSRIETKDGIQRIDQLLEKKEDFCAKSC
ncbi:MAG: hypothetical protein MJA29_13865, partial [Candidatus Omnitrophica bacterium]|nr:hypothetical protein [Candidatus Omnitrophota bacterium]